MDYSFVGLSAFDDREKAVSTIQRYDSTPCRWWTPTVSSSRSSPWTTSSTWPKEEATEDFHKTAAVTPLYVELQLILTRWKLDPSVASSPLITTIADTAGLLIYCSVAAVILRVGV